MILFDEYYCFVMWYCIPGTSAWEQKTNSRLLTYAALQAARILQAFLSFNEETGTAGNGLCSAAVIARWRI